MESNDSIKDFVYSEDSETVPEKIVMSVGCFKKLKRQHKKLKHNKKTGNSNV